MHQKIDKASPTTPGGIDLSADQFGLEVQGKGEDFKFNFDPAKLQNMNIDGFFPIIINVAPMSDLPLFLSSNNSTSRQLTISNK